jgi:hypothetical protein
MGWRLRRSITVGGARVNLSGSGIGWSWGVPGFRYGRTAVGRAYVSIGVPGTGIYWVHYFGSERTHGNDATR